jgi:CO/xanthine dehydrogenase FAD-binding subunit
MTQATEVLLPTSADEAVALFGDGSGVTIVAGGTIVVPEITHGWIAPTRAPSGYAAANRPAPALPSPSVCT